jgi:uncharacterized protein YdaU (DUF1376 family)
VSPAPIGAFTQTRAHAWTAEDHGFYLIAASHYWTAATFAPTPHLADVMLRKAWICSERAAGRVSQLEVQ